jgi:hypothetical protein
MEALASPQDKPGPDESSMNTLLILLLEMFCEIYDFIKRTTEEHHKIMSDYIRKITYFWFSFLNVRFQISEESSLFISWQMKSPSFIDETVKQKIKELLCGALYYIYAYRSYIKYAYIA